MSDPLFNRQNLAIALLEQRARELWAAWEPGLRWEDAPREARDPYGCVAFDQLLAEGAIRCDGSSIQAVGGLA